MSKTNNTNKKRILLIYPPSQIMNWEDSCQQPIFCSSNQPPMDLMYLAAISEECGLEAQMKNYSIEGDFLNELKEFNPHYLVANISTRTFASDMEWIKKAKEINPSMRTIVTGKPFLTYNQNAIYENPYIDYVIVGESEFSLRDILNNVPDNEILGICYRENFQSQKTEKRPYIEHLDSIPFPARHLINNSVYKNPTNGKTKAAIVVSRGCPFNCFFCLATISSGAKIRYRSAENIINEIKECVDKFNITDFEFISDVFNFNRDWTINLCKKIIENGLKITWTSNVRIENIDNTIATLMYKAGCRLVNIGVESGSQIILDHIGKNLKLDDIKNATNIFKKNKIKICNNFIIGLPWETEETVEETINFAIKLNSEYANFYIATPLPGSGYFGYAISNKLVEGNFEFTNAFYAPIIRTQKLNKEQVFKLYQKAIKQFYLRPQYFFKTLFTLKNKNVIKSYFLSYIKLISHK